MEKHLHRKKTGLSSYRMTEPRTHSFFKFYDAAKGCSHQLKIPSPFLKFFNGDIPKMVHLKNIWGRVWRAKVEVAEDHSVYITQGLEQYVADHSVKSGDFLVFQLVDKSAFFVRVFGPNACMKEEPLDRSVANIPIRKSAKTNERATGVARTFPTNQGEYADKRIIRFSKTVMTGFRNCVGVPKHVLDECDYTLPQDVILRNKANMRNYTRTQMRETADRVVLGFSGLTVFWKENRVMAGDRLVFDVILGKERKIQEFHVKIIHKAMRRRFR